ncbi:MAG: chemotaxis protein CheA [Bacteriovorax sp.]
MSESNSGLDTFYAEAQELVQTLEETLLSIETEGLSADSINLMFRAIHTIKGSGGLFGLDSLVAFCHVVENTLDMARNGAWEFDSDRISALLKCTDHVRLMIESLMETGEVPVYLVDNGMELLIPLGTLGLIKELSTDTDIEWVEDDTEVDGPENGAENVKSNYWHISVAFGFDTFRKGMDPASFLSFLAKFGKIIQIKNFLMEMDWDSFDPKTCYLVTEFSFECSAEKKEIEQAFVFIKEDSQITVLPPRSTMSSFVDFMEKHSLGEKRLGELLIECESLTAAELGSILKMKNDKVQSASIIARKDVEPSVVENIAHKEVADAAVKKQKAVVAKTGDQRQYIKIDSEKLDSLINLVGELVIASAGTKLLTKETNNLTLVESVEHVEKLVEQIRDSSLGLRMVPIDTIFQRFPRVIRDVSKELGKEIQLEISGADTELDKSIIEKLTDPLTHIVRNAMDHGLETTEKRMAMGKDPTGKICLSAYHESGNVVIEIEDDGGGLDRDRILKKAIEREIIKAEDQLSDNDIFNLIFEPGFSTAEKVTNLSGRGVGMDVVRQAVHEMRGQVEIESEKGVGSIFRIRLPLTLAIIDAFLVEVGNGFFVIPLEMVSECLKLPEILDKNHDLLSLRGEALPLIYLRKLLRLKEEKDQIENVVVVQVGNNKVGIVVGRLAGELQAVIKPPAELFKNIRGVAGSTILGNGTVALMLDLQDLTTLSQRTESCL